MGCGTPGSPCTCGQTPCAPTCPAARDTVFTVPTAECFAGSLSRALIPVADAIRDIAVQLGERPYVVRWIFTRFAGGARGIGEENVVSEEIILPVPMVLDLQTLTPVVSPVGSDERGGVLLTEISGCYTEEKLRGLDEDNGAAVPADQAFYYEIEFLRADGVKSERRRFNLGGMPAYSSEDAMWQVRLERARPDRLRSGAVRGVPGQAGR